MAKKADELPAAVFSSSPKQLARDGQPERQRSQQPANLCSDITDEGMLLSSSEA